MDAGYQIIFRCFWATTLTVIGVCSACEAATFRTRNFIAMSRTPALAQAVGQAAEGYRHDLAEHWLGQPLPPWPSPCPIRVIAGDLPAQGVTQYNRSPVRDFPVEVVG